MDLIEETLEDKEMEEGQGPKKKYAVRKDLLLNLFERAGCEVGMIMFALGVQLDSIQGVSKKLYFSGL